MTTHRRRSGRCRPTMTGIWSARASTGTPFRWNGPFPDGGKLDFLSAGRQNRDYSAAVCSLDWDNFYDRLGGGRFFRAMREDMKKNYDYVLIDSRTGLSRRGGHLHD